MKEIWKDVKGYEGLYKVSNTGSILGLKRSTTPGGIISISQIKGYRCFTIWKEGKGHTKRVGRLVAEAFIREPLDGEQVNHIDRNKLNDFVDNLEWTTARQNTCHREISRKKPKTSRFIGVSLSTWKDKKYWVATCHINKKIKYLGSYKTEEEAYQARIDFLTQNNISKKYA